VTGAAKVYSVTGFTGSHTNVAPVVVLKDPKVVPAGVAIEPSGTGTGALIKASAGVPGKFRAHMGKRLQQIH
jgi:hypothetical protein